MIRGALLVVKRASAPTLRALREALASQAAGSRSLTIAAGPVVLTLSKGEPAAREPSELRARVESARK